MYLGSSSRASDRSIDRTYTKRAMRFRSRPMGGRQVNVEFVQFEMSSIQPPGSN